MRIIFLAILIPLFAALSSRAQSNHAALFRSAATRVALAKPVVTGVITNAGPNQATIEVNLPKDLSRYHVVEQHALASRAATNFTATSANQVRASIAAETTLMFMERETQGPAKRGSPPSPRPLFSTVLVRAEPPARPGQPPHTTSGTLTMFAEAVPTPWNEASNAYVAYLSVMFLTDEPNSSLLPIEVTLGGTNVKSIDPRKITLDKANPDGSADVVVAVNQFLARCIEQPHHRIEWRAETVGHHLDRHSLTLFRVEPVIIEGQLVTVAIDGHGHFQFLR